MRRERVCVNFQFFFVVVFNFNFSSHRAFGAQLAEPVKEKHKKKKPNEIP